MGVIEIVVRVELGDAARLFLERLAGLLVAAAPAHGPAPHFPVAAMPVETPIAVPPPCGNA